MASSNVNVVDPGDKVYTFPTASPVPIVAAVVSEEEPHIEEGDGESERERDDGFAIDEAGKGSLLGPAAPCVSSAVRSMAK